MATTTNYSWTTPDDTDLVKDGAAAIRTLGSSIDTTTKNLNPQTTTGAIAYRSATSNVNTSLALGTAGQVLTVNSGATAPEWATPASGGWTSIASGSLPVGSALAITSIPTTYFQLVFIIRNAVTSGNSSVTIRFNNDNTAGNYFYATQTGEAASSTMTNTMRSQTAINTVQFGTDNVANNFAQVMTINNYNSSVSNKLFNYQNVYSTDTIDFRTEIGWGGYKSNTAITQINISNTDFTAGTYVLYGVK